MYCIITWCHSNSEAWTFILYHPVTIPKLHHGPRTLRVFFLRRIPKTGLRKFAGYGQCHFCWNVHRRKRPAVTNPPLPCTRSRGSSPRCLTFLCRSTVCSYVWFCWGAALRICWQRGCDDSASSVLGPAVLVNLGLTLLDSSKPFLKHI